MNLEWKKIASNTDDPSKSQDRYYAADVPGGYILRHEFYTGGYNMTETMVFIPTVISTPTVGLLNKKVKK